MRVINATIAALAVCALVLVGAAVRSTALPHTVSQSDVPSTPFFTSTLSGPRYGCRYAPTVHFDGSTLVFLGSSSLWTGVRVRADIEVERNKQSRATYSASFRIKADEQGFPIYFCLIRGPNGLVGLIILNAGDTAGAPNFGLLLEPEGQRSLRVIRTPYVGYALMSIKDLGGKFSWLTRT